MQERDIEEYTRKYLEAPFLKENVYYRRKCVLEQLRKYKHSSILEIGCGMFPLFQYMEEDEYENYYVVEPSKIFSDNAKKLAEKRMEGRVYVCTGFFETIYKELLEIKPDFIICSSLLHEVLEEKLLLESIYAVADEKTVIHINVPNALSMHRLIAQEMGIIENIYEKSETQNELQQRDVYDMRKLKVTLEENNFRVLDEGSYFIKPFTHYQMSLLLKYQIINEAVLDGLWKLTEYFPENGSEIFVNIKTM